MYLLYLSDLLLQYICIYKSFFYIYVNCILSYVIMYFINYITIVFRFIVPVSMIVINDVMAYMFGFFFGRTPLIKLSPKKTWEGFIGGGISTVILGLMVTYFLYK